MYTHQWRKTCFLQDEYGVYTMLSAPTTHHVTYIAPVNPTVTKQAAAQAATEATSPVHTSKQLLQSSSKQSSSKQSKLAVAAHKAPPTPTRPWAAPQRARTPHTPGYTRVNTNTTTDETTGCVTACAAPHATSLSRTTTTPT